jgi:hypothetical protein
MKKLFVIMLFVLAGCSAAPKVQKNPMRIYDSAQEFMEQFKEGACNDLGSSCSAMTVLYGCPVRVDALIFGEASHTEAWPDTHTTKVSSAQYDSCFEQAKASLIPAGVKTQEEPNGKYWLQHNRGAYWVLGTVEKDKQEDRTIGIRFYLEYKELSPEQQLALKQ